MDTKRLFLAMALTLVILFGWNAFVSYLYKRQGWTPPVAQTETNVNTPTTAASAPATTGPIASAVAPTTAPAGLRIAAATAPAATQPGNVILGSNRENDSKYVLALDLSAQGAGLNKVVLNQFRTAVGAKDPYDFQKPLENQDDTRPLATRSVTVNGNHIDLTASQWRLESSSADHATYVLDIAGDSGPLVRLRKTFDVRTREDTKGKSEGYEVGVKLGFENLSDTAATVQYSMNGTVPPPVEIVRGPDRTVIAAYNETGVAQLGHHTVEEFTKSKPAKEITRSEKGDLPLLWFGCGNTYFDAIVRPIPIEPSAQAPAYVQKVEARGLNFDTRADEHDVIVTMNTGDLTLAPKQSISLPLEVFFGPKQRTLLGNSYYSSPLLSYNATLVMTGGICGACTFQWLIDVLVRVLIILHTILRDWGLAIIGLVAIVRIILHPITKKSQVNMMKMGKMGPEFERLKKKFGDDKEAMAKAQMDLYKQMGFTPVLGCLPMFLQMPIFIALWACLQSTFELRHSPFLHFFGHNLTWIKDLSQPDMLIRFSHPLNLGWFTLDALNLLPLLVAVVSFFNMKMTPQPPATTPEAEQQRKMMQWMTLIFPLMFYKMPSGLNIYYLTTTTLGILEGKVIRDHIKQREEAEKAGKVIVDAGMSSKKKLPPKKDDPPKRSKLGGWLANLQEKAEQIQKETNRRGGKAR